MKKFNIVVLVAVSLLNTAHAERGLKNGAAIQAPHDAEAEYNHHSQEWKHECQGFADPNHEPELAAEMDHIVRDPKLVVLCYSLSQMGPDPIYQNAEEEIKRVLLHPARAKNLVLKELMLIPHFVHRPANQQVPAMLNEMVTTLLQHPGEYELTHEQF